MKHSDMTQADKVRGSMIGGAAGDALGYAVEFMRLRMIKQRYGKEGITEYDLEPYFLSQSGKGFISDDTQMALFTANGILMHDFYEGRKPLPYCVYLAYLDWLKTQGDDEGEHYTWLYEIPELHHRRAPGITCTSALMSGKMGTITAPLNDSKGCGGIMRVAPIGLRYIPETDIELRRLDSYGADISAITHGHSLGWFPSAILTHILIRLMQSYSLKDAVQDAWTFNKNLFAGKISESDSDRMFSLMDMAYRLANSKYGDEHNIRQLGEGWIAEETLAIALYCAFRYTDDFSKALIVSVNHDGDSDSTGAVAGNIMGAIVGYDAIADKWKNNLELKDVILEISDDLCSDLLPGGKYKMKAYDIERFIDAQDDKNSINYEHALNKIRNGKKRTHWIWYIFPQIKGLGHSRASNFFGIEDISEAREYISHPVLGTRLRGITEALLSLNENDPVKIMGEIDAMKLKSCMTLFAQVSEKDSVFHKALDKFFNGIQDEKTLQYIQGMR